VAREGKNCCPLNAGRKDLAGGGEREIGVSITLVWRVKTRDGTRGKRSVELGGKKGRFRSLSKKKEVKRKRKGVVM